MNQTHENKVPLISIVVLTYNRSEILLNTIKKVYEIEYKNKEIIVVDNASSDNTIKILEQKYPEINLIKLEKNYGVPSWNYGYKSAKGDYVLLLDDDAYPEKYSLQKSTEIFYKNENVACIAFKILNENGEYGFSGKWQPPEGYTGNYWPVFNGCCVLLNKKKLHIDVLIPFNFSKNLHELPVSSFIHNLGYEIYFDNSITAIHDFKSKKGYDSYNDSLIFKNSLIFSLSFLPHPFSILDTIRNILFYFTRSLKWGWFKSYIQSIVKLKKIKVERINLKYYKELKKLQLHFTPFHRKIIRK